MSREKLAVSHLCQLRAVAVGASGGWASPGVWPHGPSESPEKASGHQRGTGRAQ